MINSLKIRNENEVKHWRKFRNDVDRFWLHHTAVGQARIKYRANLIAEFVGKEKDLKVLEIGAGNGWYSAAFAKYGWDLIISDLSAELLARAKRKIKKSKGKTEFFVADAYKMPFADKSFNAVIGSSILHHIDLKAALPEIFRVTKSGGRIAFCEPNMLNPQIALQKNIPYLKRRAGDSPDETAYFRWQITKILQKHKYVNHKVFPIDFLHPKTPAIMLKHIERISRILEKIPIIKEIGGSLFIGAVKPD